MNNLLTMEEHFAKAIDANPHDLETRQAYSDWLEEQGREEEAAAWWEVRDRVPCKGLDYKGMLFGWFPAVETEYLEKWNDICPLAIIPEAIFDLIPDGEEKHAYKPFVNLSALVRVMIDQQAIEVPV